MQRDPSDPGTPKDWMTRARSNLARAKQTKPDEVLWEDLCYDAQQAAEKSLKAVLIAKGIAFRFVHNIGELLNLLATNGVEIPVNLLEASELTEFAVEARYPGPFEPVTEDETRQAIETAEKVVLWASSIIEK